MNLIGSRYCRETLKMVLCFRESIQRRGVISIVANRSSCSSTHLSNVLGSSKCLQFLVSIEWMGYQRKSYVSTMGYLFVQYTLSKWVSNTNRIVLNIKWSIWFSSIDLHTYTENNRFVFLLCLHDELSMQTLIARFMGPTWGSSGAHMTKVGHVLAPWILLSGNIRRSTAYTESAGGNQVPLLRRVSKIVSMLWNAEQTGFPFSIAYVQMYSKLQRGMHTHTHIKCVIIWSSYDPFCFNRNWTRVTYVESRIYLYILGNPLVIKYTWCFFFSVVTCCVALHCLGRDRLIYAFPGFLQKYSKPGTYYNHRANSQAFWYKGSDCLETTRYNFLFINNYMTLI